MDEEEFEAELLNSSGPEFEMIELASTVDNALNIANGFAEYQRLNINKKVMINVVKKIRDLNE